MFQLLKSGGLLMIPIIICGILATFIIIERCIYFHNVKKKDADLIKNLEGVLQSKNYEGGVIVCTQANTPLSQVLKKAFESRFYQEDDLKAVVSAEMNFVIPKLEHLITTLGTIANISTLLGLLGTVTGNIKAFGVLGAGGSMGDPALLAGAIAEALMTTVAGLVVSIPSVIFHNYFVGQVNHRVVEMDAHVTNIILKMSGRVR